MKINGDLDAAIACAAPGSEALVFPARGQLTVEPASG
jgi:hypothetical protein